MKLLRCELRFATILGAALIPKDSLGGLREDFDFGAALQKEVARAPLGTTLVVRIALWLAWCSPFMQRRSLHTFGALDAGEREALLEELLDSRFYGVRELVGLLKLFACLTYLGDRRVLAHLGAYDLGPGPLRLRGRP